MALYQIHTIHKAGFFTTPPEVVECKDDASAIIEARRRIIGYPAEVWCGKRFVVRLDPQQAPPVDVSQIRDNNS